MSTSGFLSPSLNAFTVPLKALSLSAKFDVNIFYTILKKDSEQY
jgi:hypothetical protein